MDWGGTADHALAGKGVHRGRRLPGPPGAARHPRGSAPAARRTPQEACRLVAGSPLLRGRPWRPPGCPTLAATSTNENGEPPPDLHTPRLKSSSDASSTILHAPSTLGNVVDIVSTSSLHS